MHHHYANETHKEKAIWELHKNVMCCFEQILEATPHKTLAIRPLTSHLTNYPSKTNKPRCALLEKNELIRDLLLSTATQVNRQQGLLHQL